MPEELLTYQKFIDESSALDMAAVLADNEIAYEVEETLPTTVGIYATSSFNKEFLVKIKSSDFEKVDALMLDISKKQTEDVEKEYYLYEFEDHELMDIVTKPEEWSKFDYVLAQKILKERGKELKPAQLKFIKERRLEELKKPEASQKTWIIIGYVLAVLGGFVGLFIGWHLATFKKTLPNGEKKYAYSEIDRKHGGRIFVVGMVFTIIWIGVKIFSHTND